MLFNLRGPSGAGKSTAVRHVLERYPREKIEQEGWRKRGARVVAYELPGSLTVLGNYEYYQMGGMDGFKPYQRMWDLIREFATTRDFVIYESLLLAGEVSKSSALMEEFGGSFLFLDTSADECIRRVYSRNGGKAIKEEVIRTNHERIRRMSVRFQGQGKPVGFLDYRRSGEHLEEVLRSSGWDPGDII